MPRTTATPTQAGKIKALLVLAVMRCRDATGNVVWFQGWSLHFRREFHGEKFFILYKLVQSWTKLVQRRLFKPKHAPRRRGALRKTAQTARIAEHGGAMTFLGFRARIFVFIRAIIGKGVGHLWSYPSEKLFTIRSAVGLWFHFL